jgi:hypothetical protein
MHPETKTIFATSLSLSIEKFVFLGFFIDNFLPSADSLDGVCVCVCVCLRLRFLSSIASFLGLIGFVVSSAFVHRFFGTVLLPSGKD